VVFPFTPEDGGTEKAAPRNLLRMPDGWMMTAEAGEHQGRAPCPIGKMIGGRCKMHQ
jgi:hypothetical protein